LWSNLHWLCMRALSGDNALLVHQHLSECAHFLSDLLLRVPADTKTRQLRQEDTRVHLWSAANERGQLEALNNGNECCRSSVKAVIPSESEQLANTVFWSCLDQKLHSAQWCTFWWLTVTLRPRRACTTRHVLFCQWVLYLAELSTSWHRHNTAIHCRDTHKRNHCMQILYSIISFCTTAFFFLITGVITGGEANWSVKLYFRCGLNGAKHNK